MEPGGHFERVAQRRHGVICISDEEQGRGGRAANVPVELVPRGDVPGDARHAYLGPEVADGLALRSQGVPVVDELVSCQGGLTLRVGAQDGTGDFCYKAVFQRRWVARVGIWALEVAFWGQAWEIISVELLVRQ